MFTVPWIFAFPWFWILLGLIIGLFDIALFKLGFDTTKMRPRTLLIIAPIKCLVALTLLLYFSPEPTILTLETVYLTTDKYWFLYTALAGLITIFMFVMTSFSVRRLLAPSK